MVASMVFSITTGLLSLTGSILLICTILRSEKKLSVPYRRIIFGTSVFDVFQSLGLTSSIFLSPMDAEPPIPLAYGNITTCNLQGFFTTVGAIGVPLYLCSLSIYYFCIIRLNMRNHSFRKIEPFLHLAPILYSFSCGVFALINQYFNNAGSVCYVAPSPNTCEILPDVDCVRGEGAGKFRLRFLSFPSMIIFGVVCSTMIVITYSVTRLERRQRKYNFPRPSVPKRVRDHTPHEHKKNNCDSIWWCFVDFLFCIRTSSVQEPLSDNSTVIREDDHYKLPRPESSQSLPSSHNNIQNRKRSSRSIRRKTSNASQRSKDRTGEIMKQALFYVGSYVLSYGFVWAQTIYVLATKKPPPKALLMLSSIFFPAQGFINIFIYCRPHIVSLRRDFPNEYTWMQAFVTVLRSGGDDPLSSQERRMYTLRRASGNLSSMSELGLSLEVGESTAAPRSAAGLDDYSESESNDSIAGVIRKAERRELTEPSFCPKTETEDPTETTSWSQNSKSNEMNENDDKLSVPTGGTEPEEESLSVSVMRDLSFDEEEALDDLKPNVDVGTQTDVEDESGRLRNEIFQNSRTKKSLEDIINDAEQVLENTMGEFMELANEDVRI